MYRYLLTAVILMSTATPLAADDEAGFFQFNNDRFLAGSKAIQDQVGVDDLFMVGETVRSEQNISGSAHLAGRRVESKGTIGGDAYLAGMDVSQEGKIFGDLSASGYNIEVGEVTGDLRISGVNLTIAGPVSGYALIAGDDVRIESVIQGDVSLAAQEVDFASGAQIVGKLTIYEEKVGELEVPANVVSGDRVERREIDRWARTGNDAGIWSWRRALGSFISGVLLVAGIAALIAAFVPTKLAELRRSILEEPSRSLVTGFLVLSALIGSTIVLMMTGIGLVIAPATVILALLGAFAGYVVGAYAIGVGLLLLLNRPEPDSFGTRAMAAAIGALAIGLIALIPIVGWLCVMAVTLAGVGAIGSWLFRPKLFATA